MELPKANGEVDTKQVASIIYTHIVNQVHAYNGIDTVEDGKFNTENERYIKNILDSVIEQNRNSANSRNRVR